METSTHCVKVGPVKSKLPLADRLPWVPFKKKMCSTCWATCCHAMPVETSVPDLIRLGFLTSREASSDLTASANRLVKKGIIKKFTHEPLVFVLRQKRNKDCIFLDESRRCTVYENRPAICREFPRIGPKPGHCPYRNVTDAK